MQQYTMLLNKILETTTAFVEEIPKKDRKNIGQFFTSKPIAHYMGTVAFLLSFQYFRLRRGGFLDFV
jgi:hypothetical protein